MNNYTWKNCLRQALIEKSEKYKVKPKKSNNNLTK